MSQGAGGGGGEGGGKALFFPAYQIKEDDKLNRIVGYK